MTLVNPGQEPALSKVLALVFATVTADVPAGEHTVPLLASFEGLHLESEHGTASFPAPKAPSSRSNFGLERWGRLADKVTESSRFGTREKSLAATGLFG